VSAAAAAALFRQQQRCVDSCSAVSTAAALFRQQQRCVDSCSAVSTAAALCRQQHCVDSSISSTLSTAALCRHQQHCVDSNITVSTAAALYRQQHQPHGVDSSNTVSTSVALCRQQQHCVDSTKTLSQSVHKDHGLLRILRSVLPVRAIADTRSKDGVQALANCPVRRIGLACDGGKNIGKHALQDAISWHCCSAVQLTLQHKTPLKGWHEKYIELNTHHTSLYSRFMASYHVRVKLAVYFMIQTLIWSCT
jgi:hypothetical protein